MPATAAGLTAFMVAPPLRRRWFQPTPSAGPASLEDKLLRYPPGAIVPRAHDDPRAGWRTQRPFALPPVGGELRIREERLQGDLVGAPFELPALVARLAGDELRGLRQPDLVDHAAADLALERALGDVRRQVAGVVHRE